MTRVWLLRTARSGPRDIGLVTSALGTRALLPGCRPAASDLRAWLILLLGGGDAGSRGNLGREIFLRLLDTFAQGETGKPGQGDAGFLRHGADPALAVMHPDLLQQHDFLVVFPDAPFDHLLDDRLGLAGGTRLLRQHL